MSNLKIKKGDNVLINAGKDLGKRGTVEKVFPKKNEITVTGINITKKHLKPSRKSPHGGIIDKIAPINISNATIVCPRCSNPTKIGYRITEQKKMRICKKCQESIDA